MSSRGRPMLAAGLAAVAICASGCGAQRSGVPDLPTTPAAPDGISHHASPGGDVEFEYPGNWSLEDRRPPGVATVASGGASITVWAYRSQSLVFDTATADAAMKRYLTSLKQRDPGFKVQSQLTVVWFEAPGFEITGVTEIDGRQVRIRSTHLFRGQGEYVVDQIADVPAFMEVNDQVFSPFLLAFRFFGKPAIAGGDGAAAPTPAAAP